MKKPFLKIVTGVALALSFSGVVYVATRTPLSAQPRDVRASDEGARIRDALQNDTAVPRRAPPGFDVTIIVFSDYQCPYCRKLHPSLEALLRSDPKVRIVYRDWPIFGDVSVEAARAAMASRYQGKHEAFNDALLDTKGKLTSEGIRAAAASAGVDWQRLQADLVRHRAEIDGALLRTDHYARLIGLSGTPALIIDSYLFPGAISDDILDKAVQVSRQHLPLKAG